MGALALVGTQCMQPKECKDEKHVADDQIRKGITVLEMLLNSIHEEDTANLSFMYDELSTLLHRSQSIHPTLYEWLATHVSTPFAERCCAPLV